MILPKNRLQALYARAGTVVGFCLFVLCWGLFPVVTRWGVQQAPPLFLSSLRLGIATCVMAGLIAVSRQRMLLTRREHGYALQNSP